MRTLSTTPSLKSHRDIRPSLYTTKSWNALAGLCATVRMVASANPGSVCMRVPVATLYTRTEYADMQKRYLIGRVSDGHESRAVQPNALRTVRPSKKRAPSC